MLECTDMIHPSPALALAATEYRWLLDRGYAESAALKLVGDHHQLPGDERVILFRGIASSEDSATRASVVAAYGDEPDEALANRELLVDAYNQTLTVMHYLAGRPLFVATDGLTRDSGGSFGHIPNKALFERAAEIIVHRLATLGGKGLRRGRVVLYLDAPVSGSRGHAALFDSLFAAKGVEAEVRLERSADAPLKRAQGDAIVATCDSAIVAAIAAARGRGESRAEVYDAARASIELAFRARRSGAQGRDGHGDRDEQDRSGILDIGELLLGEIRTNGH
jgi:hypothetical protein